MTDYEKYAKPRCDIKRQYVRDYLSTHPCVNCGESDIVVLEFNHKDATTKRNNVSMIMKTNHSLKVLIEEIEKCEVLCANCHKRATAKQFGSHKL